VPARTSVFVVDDHPVVREGLKMLLDSSGDVRVVGGSASVHAALPQLAQLSPDVVLLDLDLGEEDGLESLPRIVAAAPRARVLILTALRHRVKDEAALRGGARGLILKDASPEVLLRAIRTVAEGDLWFDRAVLDTLRSERPPAAGSVPPSAQGLTAREREIVELVTEGLRNEEVARRLGISEKTVRNHLTAIFDKLGVSGRLELLAFAHQHGLARTRS
jgi:DNA-binding NarL/FixJ family response regulator